MKIYDETMTIELDSPDLTLGHLEPSKRLVKHHDAVHRRYHYEIMEGTVSEQCPNGLRREVEDVAAAAAWDEYEAVKRYIPYTDEELAEKATEAEKKAAEEKARHEAMEKIKAEAEAKIKAEKEQSEKIARIDSIDAQATYTAMMTDTLMEES